VSATIDKFLALPRPVRIASSPRGLGLTGLIPKRVLSPW
jgi:hypothetical protein